MFVEIHVKGPEAKKAKFPNCVCSLYGNTKTQASKIMTVFVNTLLEQLEHHKSDTALSLSYNNTNGKR